jgi:hypothetical protein
MVRAVGGADAESIRSVFVTIAVTVLAGPLTALCSAPEPSAELALRSSIVSQPKVAA